MPTFPPHRLTSLFLLILAVAASAAAAPAGASAAPGIAVRWVAPAPAARTSGTGSASDCEVRATPVASVRRVEFFVGQAPKRGARPSYRWIGADSRAPFRCSWRASTARPGRYVLYAKVVPRAGKETWRTIGVTVTAKTSGGSQPAGGGDAGTSQAQTTGSAPASSGGAVPIGISASLRYVNIKELPARIATLRAAGMEYSREDLSWNEIETSRGNFDWTRYDGLVLEAARQGLGLILIPNSPPRWATSDPNTAPPSSGSALDAYTAFVKAAVARYGTTGTIWDQNPDVARRPVTQWDIWNEPYMTSTWGPRDPNGGEYARMFKAAAVAGRQADPAAEFMFEGELGANTGSWPQPAWFEQAFDAVPDLAKYLDQVSIHPYTNEDDPNGCTPGAGGLGRFWYETRFQFCRIKDARKVLDAHGAKRAKLWITEIGWPTSGERSVTEAQQAQYVRDVFRQLRRWKVADGLVFYHYMTREESSGSEQWFGFVHPDGSPKPAWNALLDETRSGLTR